MTFLADNPVSHLAGWSDSASIKVQAPRLAFLHSLLIDGGPFAGLGLFSGFSSLHGCPTDVVLQVTVGFRTSPARV